MPAVQPASHALSRPPCLAAPPHPTPLTARSRTFSHARKPAILQLLLGPCCNVVSPRKDQSIKLKEEYHHFRNRSGACIAVPLA